MDQKKPRRYQPRETRADFGPSPPSSPGGVGFYEALLNPRYCEVFAQVSTAFVHLEHDMKLILALTLDDPGLDAAPLLWQKLRSNQNRSQVIKTLLQGSRKNVGMPEEFDLIIKEFEVVSAQRNHFAHGRWWTMRETGAVYFLDGNTDAWLALNEAKPLPIDELQGLLERVVALRARCLEARVGWKLNTQSGEAVSVFSTAAVPRT